MRIQEYNFAKETTPDVQAELLRMVEQSSSLDEIFDYWFFKRGQRLSLSVMVNDDHTLNRDCIACYFDTSDGAVVGSVFLFRSEILPRYPDVVSIDSFIKGKVSFSHPTEMHDEKYDEWMTS